MTTATTSQGDPQLVDPSVVIQKPGHGLNIDYQDGRIFPNALVNLDRYKDQVPLPMITLRELKMLSLINTVTDRPDWHEKVFNEVIVNKWKSEFLEAVKSNKKEKRRIQLKIFDYCLQELRGAIQVFPADVYKSDTAIPNDTKDALQKAVRALEDVPKHQKDWHPGFNGKVLDLVHPSLFPLVYGASRVLPVGAKRTTLDDCIRRCGEGEVIPVHNADATDDKRYHAYSQKFQWLLCEVDVSGGRPKVTTYINNLHPVRHRDLYTIIEDIIGAAIPLWNLTLAAHEEAAVLTARYHSTWSPDITDLSPQIPHRIHYTEAKYEFTPEFSEPPTKRRRETEYDFNARANKWARARDSARKVFLPEPPEEFEPLRQPPPFSLAEKYGRNGEMLQIVVKLANIELTPENSEYEGGTWHVEGQMNEAICASAIYYYSSSNVTPSYLSFRQQSRNDTDPLGADDTKRIRYDQDFRSWLPAVFGLKDGESTVQTLGSVETREGRFITFPNILQHQVQPFRLKDAKNPGHRKILALFLVDPGVNVISTADVPVQRRDWWREELLARREGNQANQRLGAPPAELQDMVFAGVEGFPIDLETAKEYREELMEERKEFVIHNGKYFASENISLCEH